MPLELHFSCPLQNGIHARPASALEKVARAFTSEIVLLNERNSCTVNCKNVLAIISADIRHDNDCYVKIAGSDEQEAMKAISNFLRDQLPHCDDSSSVTVKPKRALWLPPGLRNAGMTIRQGTPVVSGIGVGQMVRAAKFGIPSTLPINGIVNPEAECQKMEKALRMLVAGYDHSTNGESVGFESELEAVHLAMARDEDFRQLLFAAITQRHRTAAGAIADALKHFSTVFEASGNQLLRERIADIQDVCLRLLQFIYGNAAIKIKTELTSDAVVIAENLTPSQFLALDRHFLKGLVIIEAAATSHTVILARSFGIPTLVGIEDFIEPCPEGQIAVVDADVGVLVTNLTDAGRRYYAMEQRRLADRHARIQQCIGRMATIQDGCRIEVAANISTTNEASLAFTAGAEGIGLFRTEMLFLDREAASGETEQFEAYRSVIAAADGRPVVIRTFDIGGDKPATYLSLPKEKNPFLGRRAVRLYPELENMFRTQVRALVRASAQGRLKIMVPMIATINEARWVKQIILQEQTKCREAGIPFDAGMPIGAMIEVPAAVFALKQLCREFDFFSVGSNDLLQYFMASDRSNQCLASLNDPLQPAFLGLLKQIVLDAHAHGKPVSLCGEMGGQVRLCPLLAGLGFEGVSVPSPAIANLKAALARLTLPACQQLLDAALSCSTAHEVEILLEKFGEPHDALIDPELVIPDTEAATQEEAIKCAVDRLYVLGRIEEPHVVEEAIWQRETSHPTAFGNGFAIPHCRTNAVKSSSLVLLKLRSPVAWSSSDNTFVHTMILLAMRDNGASNEHMQCLSKLARQLMHEDFRTRLEHEMNPEVLCAFLRSNIEN